MKILPFNQWNNGKIKSLEVFEFFSISDSIKIFKMLLSAFSEILSLLVFELKPVSSGDFGFEKYLLKSHPI